MCVRARCSGNFVYFPQNTKQKRRICGKKNTTTRNKISQIKLKETTQNKNSALCLIL